MADSVEMIERLGPTFVQFSPGETVEGVLLSRHRVLIQGKPAIKYLVSDEGTEYAFLGTYQINEKLLASHVGKRVRVQYEGEDAYVGRGGNKMRHFRVWVSEKIVDPLAAKDALLADLTITDDDIPF